MKRNIFLTMILLSLCCIFLIGCGSQTVATEESAAIIETEAAPSIYSNSQMGISFILPAGWNAESIGENKEELLITGDSDGFPVMMYASQDMWPQMDEETRTNLSRDVLNNDMLSIDIAVDMFGSLGADRERVELNDYEFFRCRVNDFVEDADECIVWYRMENGWVDIFAFGADEENPFYGQFQELISSAVYDREYEAETTADHTEAEASEDDYLPAEWSDELFSRNGCSGYPMILDTPLKKCRGFTVDYTVADVTDGKMKTDAKFQIFYQTADGTWIKGKTFTLDDGFASVEQSIDKPVTVTQVIVMCLNAGNFSWNESMGIKNPIF